MPPRYYWISALILVAFTAAISFATHRRSRKDVLIILCWVAGGMALLTGLVVGASWLLVALGIAEKGFVL
ncbi:MAG: hypothetical protein ACE5G9_00975 [Nitrospinales bacterium]